MVLIEISQEGEKVIYLQTDNNWDFPGSGSQVENADLRAKFFKKVQKSPRAKSMSKCQSLTWK